MVYNGHMEHSEQVAQGIIQWAGIATLLFLFIILSHLPTRKGIFSFSEASGLFLDEEAPPSNRLHLSQQQNNLNTLLLEVNGLILNIRYILPLEHQVNQIYFETLTSLPVNALSLL